MRHKPTCLWGLLAFHPKLPPTGMFPISWDPPTEPWGWEVGGGPPCSQGLDLGSGNRGPGAERGRSAPRRGAKQAIRHGKEAAVPNPRAPLQLISSSTRARQSGGEGKAASCSPSAGVSPGDGRWSKEWGWGLPEEGERKETRAGMCAARFTREFAESLKCAIGDQKWKKNSLARDKLTPTESFYFWFQEQGEQQCFLVRNKPWPSPTRVR